MEETEQLILRSVLSCLSVTLVYCGQTVGRIQMKLCTQVGLGPGHTLMLDADPGPLPKRGTAPYFRPISVVSKWLDRSRCHLVGIGRPRPKRHCVRWDPGPPRQKGAEPQFPAHVYCAQTAGYIKMPLGMEVGLSQGDFVFDGDPAHSPKRGQSPQFSAHVYCGHRLHGSKCHLVRR